MYWFKKTEKEFNLSPSRAVWLGLLPKNYSSDANLQGTALLKSDLIGGDYVKSENDPNRFTDYFVWNQYNSYDLDITRDKIYLGLASTRYELYKIHSIIRRLEQNKLTDTLGLYPHDLMDLRLVAWYGKGFTKMYSQHPEYPETYAMSDFIDTSGIRTAKLFHPNRVPYGYHLYYNENVNFTTNAVNTWENKDSSFFDITVLSPKNTSLNNRRVWYLGVQNRRTDPLFINTSVLPDIVTDLNNISTSPNDLQMMPALENKVNFESTVDFENKCFNSRTASFYIEHFWKRFGCRLIKIPLSSYFTNYEWSLEYTLVSEILANDNIFNFDHKQWRGDQFCHKVNYYTPSSVIYSPREPRPIVVSARFLPGEGKIIKIAKEPIPNYPRPDPPPFQGHGTSFPAPKTNGEVKSDLDNIISNYLYLRFEPVTSHDSDNEYKLVLVNNSKNNLERLPILYRVLDNSLELKQNQLIINSKLNPDCIDSLRLEEVSIIPNLKAFDKVEIANIKLESKGQLPSVVYKFDMLYEDGKNNNPCFILKNNKAQLLEAEKFKFSEYATHLNNDITIKPNPATSKIDIYFSSAEKSNSDINICDIYGASVYSIKNYMASEGKNSLSIDVSGFPVGVYNLIINFYNKSITKKFTVVR